MATEFINTASKGSTDSHASSLDGLSFTARQPDQTFDLWRPGDIAGDWTEQCHAGRKLGREASDYIRSSGDVTLLPGIVRLAAERGTFGGVEVGFFTALAEELIAVD